MKPPWVVLPLAVVVAGMVSCAEPDGTAPPVLTLLAVAGSDSQNAFVGTALSDSLRVQVRSDGAGKGGVVVNWQSSAGSILHASDTTDRFGFVAAAWTLGNMPGEMTATATVVGASGSPVTFMATAMPPLPVIAIVIDPATDNQAGVVGTALALPLRVRVLADGVPDSGASVFWQPLTGGSFTPAASRTDDSGFAEATWTLGKVAGYTTAQATVVGAITSWVPVSATALPGPPAFIRDTSGDGESVPANARSFPVLAAVVTDEYGNGVSGQAMTWTIENGPVTLAASRTTSDSTGLVKALVAPSGTPGSAVVRVALSGGSLLADFALSVDPRALLVYLDPSDSVIRFVSAMNGSTPALDTIPAGSTMIWVIDPVDYLQHGIVSIGAPSFTGGGDFPSACPLNPWDYETHGGASVRATLNQRSEGFPPACSLTVTFPMPGTYQYVDPYHLAATGTIVVQ